MATPISAPVISFIERIVASSGESCSSRIKRSTFSTTTIASSTTMPIASTRPNRERLLSVKPNNPMKKNVPTSETGMATMGITAARQVCRKTITTSTTRRIASPIVSSTAFTDCWMNSVGL